jgi:hypothetical protein
MTRAEKTIMDILEQHADHHGFLDMSLAQLEQLSQYSKRHVRRVVRQLEEAGHILTESWSGLSGTTRFFIGGEMRTNADMVSSLMRTNADMVSAFPREKEKASLYIKRSLSKERECASSEAPSSLSQRKKLESIFTSGLLLKLFSELPEREQGWLGLSLEIIADAIQKANQGQGNFKTNVKNILDVEAKLVKPQMEKISGGVKTGTKKTFVQTGTLAPGLELPAAKDVLERAEESWRKDQQQPPETDYAAMTNEAFETHIRRLGDGAKETLRGIRHRQLADRNSRQKECEAVDRKRKLEEQARALVGE